MKEINNSTIKRNKYPVKIIQFGDGNFLRGFVDWMIEKSNEAGVMNHGVTIVQPRSKKFAVDMINQNCMFHVYLEGIKDGKLVKDITLIKSVQDVINPHLEYQKYEDLFLSPDVEVVISNTTEAGIVFEEDDDVWALPPRSFPAKMTALLYKRFQEYRGAKDKGLHILCTELIEDNGSTLKSYIVQHAEKNKLTDFILWLNESCHFYDTLVDRIVSGFPKEHADSIQRELDFNDNLIVKGELFHTWAIGGNPIIKEVLPFDKAGLNVLFMDDISAFRNRKVRILNGVHTAMTSVALLLGMETVVEAIGDSLVEEYVKTIVANEILPVVEGDEDELQVFTNQILERLYNPSIQHYLKDISLNALSKWEVRNFPILADNVMLGRDARLTAFSFAALLVSYSGQSDISFEVRDNQSAIEYIQSTYNRENIEEWVNNILKNKNIWHVDVIPIQEYLTFISTSVDTILARGMRAALCSVLQTNKE